MTRVQLRCESSKDAGSEISMEMIWRFNGESERDLVGLRVHLNEFTFNSNSRADHVLCDQFYGLFKQANVGDNTTSKPGMMDFAGKYKWYALGSLYTRS